MATKKQRLIQNPTILVFQEDRDALDEFVKQADKYPTVRVFTPTAPENETTGPIRKMLRKQTVEIDAVIINHVYFDVEDCGVDEHWMAVLSDMPELEEGAELNDLYSDVINNVGTLAPSDDQTMEAFVKEALDEICA
jgi:predicted metal-dependent TIM-barrel fold hydrolase